MAVASGDHELGQAGAGRVPGGADLVGEGGRVSVGVVGGTPKGDIEAALGGGAKQEEGDRGQEGGGGGGGGARELHGSYGFFGWGGFFSLSLFFFLGVFFFFFFALFDLMIKRKKRRGRRGKILLPGALPAPPLYTLASPSASLRHSLMEKIVRDEKKSSPKGSIKIPAPRQEDLASKKKEEERLQK
jgi:hypothetical protein